MYEVVLVVCVCGVGGGVVCVTCVRCVCVMCVSEECVCVV